MLNNFLFIYIIPFCYSFLFLNNKYSPNLILRDNKLMMGGDYYINKDLYIYDLNNTIFSCIPLEHERSYYWFCSLIEEEEVGYDHELTQYIKNILEPNMKPIIIYNKESFTKFFFEKKYKKIIEYNINLYNKTWNDINKVIKIETRYEC